MTDETYAEVRIAKAIATLAHLGQVDKAGEPYIGHPERVIGFLNNPTNTEIAAAWLHDVLEDTAWTADDLKAAGVSWDVLHIVVALTRFPDVSQEDYYAGIRDSYSARRVKLADIADNTTPERLAKLDDKTIVRLIKKYAHAREVLLR